MFCLLAFDVRRDIYPHKAPLVVLYHYRSIENVFHLESYLARFKNRRHELGVEKVLNQLHLLDLVSWKILCNVLEVECEDKSSPGCRDAALSILSFYHFIN